tara:strand:+ start:1676 stop:2950 length:1275 start_codon:yes stop_codon:yes gene_type:complete
MTLVEEIIKESIQNEKLNQSRHRRMEVEKLLNYYTGTNTEGYIAQYFDASIYEDIPMYKINVTRKFIDKMSRVYINRARRKLFGSESEDYNFLTRKKDLSMKQVERMTNLIGTPALRVLFNNENDDDAFFSHDLIYYYEPHFNGDPKNPIAITYPLLSATADIRNTDELQYEYWDKDLHLIYDEDGKILMEEQNPYGVLPFLFPRDTEQIDDFINEGATDVVSVNEHVNITMTNLQLGLHYQMLGQPYATGVYSDTPIQRTGVDTIINVPEGATFGIASPQGDLSAVIETVKFQLELLAQSRHMNIIFDSNADRPSSGLALMIKDFEHIADYNDDLERYRFLEQEIYNLERIEAKANNITLPSPKDFSVEFTKLEYPTTVQEQISKEIHELERGYTTDAELLQKKKGDITLEQAGDILEKNRLG